MQHLIQKAEDDLGAASLIADIYPLQATSLLLQSIRAACLAADGSESVNENPLPTEILVLAIPSEAWINVRPRTVGKMIESAEAFISRGSKEGDIRKALACDLPTAARFIEDVKEHVQASQPAMSM